MTETIQIRNARPDEATLIASLIIQAMQEECCRYFCGNDCTMDDYLQLMAEMVRRDDTQYSYRNTLCAVNADDRPVGIIVSYDGARLAELRRPYLEALFSRYGRDMSHIDDETEAGELYLDSLAVSSDYQGQGIATRLLQAAADKAAAMGIGAVGLLVDDNNPKAEKLYHRCGFVTVGDNRWGGHAMRHLQKKTN